MKLKILIFVMVAIAAISQAKADGKLTLSVYVPSAQYLPTVKHYDIDGHKWHIRINHLGGFEVVSPSGDTYSRSAYSLDYHATYRIKITHKEYDILRVTYYRPRYHGYGYGE